MGNNWIPVLSWHEVSIQEILHTLSQLNIDDSPSAPNMNSILEQGPVRNSQTPISLARPDSISIYNNIIDRLQSIDSSISKIENQLANAKTT